jgi:cystathionine beta-lyase family protein involved in aluminum resistance
MHCKHDLEFKIKELLRKDYGIQSGIAELVDATERELSDRFQEIHRTCQFNQYKVLSAFRMERIALRHFNPSTGYGYGDDGRDALDRVFARCMGAEDALVRPQIVSGTHALALMLFGVLRPGDEMLSITGKPYDTLETTIGISGDSSSSLKSMGVSYSQVELGSNGGIDAAAAISAIKENTKVVHIQRSRGYAWRRALTVAEIGRAIAEIKAAKPGVIVTVDNCYGEFTATEEPVAVGADLMAGSLIKNPGGGIAPTGGYVAGRSDLVELVAERLTVPGIGKEVGSYAASYAPFYQGLFLAPHVVAESLKGAILASRVFEKLGFVVLPKWNDIREDVIQAVRFSKPEPLIAFCQSIQMSSPVDSFVLPEPWDMPGYQCPVIMAAGAFVQGSSIELSADAPITPPYIAYMQGGLTYEHVKLAVMSAVSDMAAKGYVAIQ